jgi:hypothetical protein
MGVKFNMLKVASLLVFAALCFLLNNCQVVAQRVGGGGTVVTRISNRCRGAKPTKLTIDERNKAQKTARWAATLNWKIENVDVYRCKSNNLMELRVEAKTLENDPGDRRIFLFFESHKSFRKALTLHAGLEMNVEYAPIDQDTLWSEGEDISFVKFLRISKVE